MFILLIVFKQNTLYWTREKRNIIEDKGDKHKLLKFKHSAE